MTLLPNSPHIITLSKIFQSRDNFSLKINKVYENTILRSQKEITLKHFAMTFSPVIFKSLLKRFAKRPPKHTAKRNHKAPNSFRKALLCVTRFFNIFPRFGRRGEQSHVSIGWILSNGNDKAHQQQTTAFHCKNVTWIYFFLFLSHS